jgi:hypothetical protein
MSLTERAGPAPDLVAMSKAMMGEGSKSFAQAAALFDRETRAGPICSTPGAATATT